MLNSILDHILFQSGDYSIAVSQVLGLLLIIILAFLAYRLTQAKWRIDFFNNHDVEQINRRRFEKYLRQLILLITILLIVRLFKLDLELYRIGKEDSDDSVVLRYSLLIIGLIILVGAWLTEWFLNNIIINKYQKDLASDDTEFKDLESTDQARNSITKLVQYVVICLALIAIIKNFNLDFELFPYTINKEEEIFRPSKILVIILVFLAAQIIVWLITQVVLFGFYQRKRIDKGSRFAINQLIKYVIYFIAAIVAIQSLGINMTLLLGGAAALLVGVGLGLQQTFNDFFSGLVLLFERTVSVGDILEVGGVVGTVKRIGLRSSIIETRANVSIVIPNSKLVNDNVNNWTHFVDYGRFSVEVGVAYGSDTSKVKKLLLKSVNDHPLILNYPTPFVRFESFGDSALLFTIYFFSNRFMIIEDVRSDVRFNIDKLFRENNINIPFPQRDLWVKNVDDFKIQVENKSKNKEE